MTPLAYAVGEKNVPKSCVIWIGLFLTIWFWWPRCFWFWDLADSNSFRSLTHLQNERDQLWIVCHAGNQAQLQMSFKKRFGTHIVTRQWDKNSGNFGRSCYWLWFDHTEHLQLRSIPYFDAPNAKPQQDWSVVGPCLANMTMTTMNQHVTA